MARGYKTGGRVKGTPNKPKPYKQIIYECISSGVSDYFETGLFAQDVQALDPKGINPLSARRGLTELRISSAER